MFKTRLLSGIILVLFLIVIVGYGGNLLFAALAAVSLVGLYEFYRALGVKNTPLSAVGYVAALVYYGMLFVGSLYLISIFSVLLLVALMAVYVFAFPKFRAEQVMSVFFGVFYVAVMLSFVYRTRVLEDGWFMVWLIFLSSWGCDTCAYCAGMLLGRHKMAPRLSPKKSVEGGVGGILGAALLGALYALAMSRWGNVSISPLFCAVVCGVGGIISQIGDLAASAVKRNYGIKDYGKLIPGHGGILDRFDSVIFTAPVIFFLALILL